jgi:hypothetical protein
LYDLESWNKSTQLSQAVGHGFERFYRHGGADDGVAPGLVPAGVVGTDHESHGARLDGREAEAVSEEHPSPDGYIPASAISGLLDMLNRACGEFSEVKKELKEVTSIKYDLTNVRESQSRTESAISDIKRDHEDSKKEHAKELKGHGFEILSLQKDVDACQQSNKDLLIAVKGLQDNMSGIFIKMAFCSGGALLAGWLIMQAIAIWDKMPHPKTANLPPVSIARELG